MHALSALAPLLLQAAGAFLVDGRVDYSGGRTGTLLLGVWTGAPTGEFTHRTVLPGPGAFSTAASWPALPGSVHFGAYLDANGDGRWQIEEPAGVARGNPIAVADGRAKGIEIALLDPPDLPIARSESRPAIREIEIVLSRSTATVRVDGAETVRGLPVGWIGGKRARAASAAAFVPASPGPPSPVALRVAGGPAILGAPPESPASHSFPGLAAARLSAILDGDFRVERRTVLDAEFVIAIERGAELPEDEIVRAADLAAAWLGTGIGSPPSFLPLVVLAGKGEAPPDQGVPIVRLDANSKTPVHLVVARALAQAWIRSLVPAAGGDPVLDACPDYLALLSARAGDAIDADAFLASFRPGDGPTLALLLDAGLRDALDGLGSLVGFLPSLAPLAERGGGSPIPGDFARGLDAYAGFDFSTIAARLLENPRGPLADHLLARAGLRSVRTPEGDRALARHAGAGPRAAALRGTLLGETPRRFPPADPSSAFADCGGAFEGPVSARDADGNPSGSSRRRWTFALRPDGGLEGIRVAIGADGAPILGTVERLRLETTEGELRAVERDPAGVERRLRGSRARGLLTLSERDERGALRRVERWRVVLDELRVERWTFAAGDGRAEVEEGRLLRR